jgi:hypothetical protein
MRSRLRRAMPVFFILFRKCFRKSLAERYVSEKRSELKKRRSNILVGFGPNCLLRAD